MRNVLILSHDDEFLVGCAAALRHDGITTFSVTDQCGVVDFMEQGKGNIDLVIVNSEKAGDETHSVLDYLSRLRPHVSVLLSCDYFSYWNDFYTWLADRCLVTPTDMTSLGEIVKQLIPQGRDDQRPPETVNYAVDWS